MQCVFAIQLIILISQYQIRPHGMEGTGHIYVICYPYTRMLVWTIQIANGITEMVSHQASVSLPTGYDKSLHYVVLPPVFDMLKRAASRSIVTVVSPMTTNMPDHTLHNHDCIPWGQIQCWCVLRPAQTLPPKGSATIIPMHLPKYWDTVGAGCWVHVPITADSKDIST